MYPDCECIVIGAGVVGLAIAAQLAQNGHEVIILEAEADFGTATSARNSEVIHAGIYYAKDSLKARYCVEGKNRLYDYCQQRQIPFNQCGKLIVATTDAQRDQLGQIRQRATDNGVDDLELLSRVDAQTLEPALACTAALLSPSTGIVDSHAFMTSLLGDVQNNGGVLALNTRVLGVEYLESASCYRVASSASSLTTKTIINAAGHGACSLLGDLPSTALQHIEPTLYKGSYFSLTSKAPFSRLIYPVPKQNGLGVHLTIDLAGRARFGPDVEPVQHEHYEVDPQRAEQFYSAIRCYWPELADNALVPDYAGIRPRVRVNGKLHTDFYIQGPAQHGLPGLVNLLGIESPGLTASLAIANHVALLLSTKS